MIHRLPRRRQAMLVVVALLLMLDLDWGGKCGDVTPRSMVCSSCHGPNKWGGSW